MGIADAAKPTFETSVSFGRFERDSLSWEKWSSFSPNKYLEEVEKCATPGSVASKKAYFEAHYKKVAAKKAESQTYPVCTEEDASRSDEDNNTDLFSKPSVNEPDTSLCDVSTELNNIDDKAEDELTDSTGGSEHCDASVGIDCVGLAGEEGKETNDKALRVSSVCNISEPGSLNVEEGPSLEFNQMEEMIKEIETIPVESVLLDEAEAQILEKRISVEVTDRHLKEVKRSVRRKKFNGLTEVEEKLPRKLAGEVMKKKENLGKPSMTKVSQKTAQTSKLPEKSKQKPLSTGSKTSHLSSSKVSKPVRNLAQLTTPASTIKKTSSSSSTRSNASGSVRDGQMAAKSLHSSVCFDGRSSNTTPLPTNRNSLIMERMKDKDIVKRAFKTFQQSMIKPIEDRVSPVTQVSDTKMQTKSLFTRASEEEHERYIEKKATKRVPSPLRLGSDKKEVLEKSIFKPAGNHLSLSKERKDRGAKLARQSLNFKATPLPRFYQADKGTKILLDKDSSKAIGL